jgi:hypothetical protein
MVHYDIAEIKARWEAKRGKPLDEHIAKELAKIDRWEEEIWQEWNRSKENAETLTQKGKKALGGKGSGGKDGGEEDKAEKQDSGEVIEVTKKQQGKTGDPRFLTAMATFMARRSALLGLDKPSRLKVSTAPDPEDVIAAMEAMLAAGTD